MTDRVLVKVSVDGDDIHLRLIDPSEKTHRSFCIDYDAFDDLEYREMAGVNDCGSFAVLRRNRADGTASMRFVWLSSSGDGPVAGWEQTVKLPFQELRSFIRASAEKGGPSKWAALSVKPGNTPKLVFCGRENLHDAVENQTVRRKLVRFLRDNFKWWGTDEIRFYNDFVPYSFSFQEFRNGQPGMCGGLILHSQKNLEKAYYSIHT